jgi:hypothetical protein
MNEMLVECRHLHNSDKAQADLACATQEALLNQAILNRVFTATPMYQNSEQATP